MLSDFIVMNKFLTHFVLLKARKVRGNHRERVRKGDEDVIRHLAIYVAETKKIWLRPFNLMLTLLC